ncbi:MAG TPA: hypothetical protein VFQ54_00525 [Thermomicrobiales bacterium]|nr:hypothetical protein [Thermomicrobiales bacterium]
MSRRRGNQSDLYIDILSGKSNIPREPDESPQPGDVTIHGNIPTPITDALVKIHNRAEDSIEDPTSPDAMLTRYHAAWEAILTLGAALDERNAAT